VAAAAPAAGAAAAPGRSDEDEDEAKELPRVEGRNQSIVVVVVVVVVVVLLLLRCLSLLCFALLCFASRVARSPAFRFQFNSIQFNSIKNPTREEQEGTEFNYKTKGAADAMAAAQTHNRPGGRFARLPAPPGFMSSVCRTPTDFDAGLKVGPSGVRRQCGQSSSLEDRLVHQPVRTAVTSHEHRARTQTNNQLTGRCFVVRGRRRTKQQG
jgi:hypothetical protein